MDIMEIQGRRVHLTQLHTQDGYGNGPIAVGCGVYEEIHGRDEWTGESIRGQIPNEALIEWGWRRVSSNLCNCANRAAGATRLSHIY